MRTDDVLTLLNCLRRLTTLDETYDVVSSVCGSKVGDIASWDKLLVNNHSRKEISTVKQREANRNIQVESWRKEDGSETTILIARASDCGRLVDPPDWRCSRARKEARLEAEELPDLLRSGIESTSSSHAC